LAGTAAPPEAPGPASARAQLAGVALQRVAQESDLVVDVDARTIDGVAVITAGACYPINADPFEADLQTLATVVKAINEAPHPVRVHLTHPMLGVGEGDARFIGVDGALRLVGVITHARIEGMRVRARVTLGEYAEASPLGRMATYLLGIATQHPSSIGLSIRIKVGWLESRSGSDHLPRLRVESLISVDFVGDPGGNSAGMLAGAPGMVPVAQTTSAGIALDGEPATSPPPEGIPMITTAQLQYLESLGLKEGATPAEIDAFISTLTAEQKTMYAGLGAPAPTATQAAGAATAGASMARAQPAPGAASNGAGLALAGTQATSQQSAAGVSVAAQIRQVAELSGLGPQWALDRITEGCTVERATQLALAGRHQQHQAVPIAGAASGVSIGADRNVETMRDAITDAILLRAGVQLSAPHPRAAEFRGRRVVDMARRMMLSLGVHEADRLSHTRLAEICMHRDHWHEAVRGTALAEGSYFAAISSFSNILGNVGRKALQLRYAQLQPQWPEFCGRHVAVDFKPVSRPMIGAVPAMVLTAPGHDTTYATRSDGGETIALSTYTNGWALTFQQIVNDDLGAFDSDPKDFAFVARDLEDSLAFGILTTNPNMSDTVALFHATHANLAASGAVLSEATVQQARTAMAKQTRLGSADPLNLVPGRCIVPVEYDFLARKLFESPVARGETSDVKNPIQGMCRVVASPRLAVTAYYFAVTPGTRGETIEIVLLEGYEEPSLRTEEDFDSLTIKYQGRHFVGAKALDHRGVYKNPGA